MKSNKTCFGVPSVQVFDNLDSTNKLIALEKFSLFNLTLKLGIFTSQISSKNLFILFKFK
jgi:hypothetical protein